MRKLSDQLEPFLQAAKIGVQKSKIVVQPAKIIAHRLLWQRSAKCRQHRPESLSKSAIAVGEKTDECGSGQPDQSPPEVGRGRAQSPPGRAAFPWAAPA